MKYFKYSAVMIAACVISGTVYAGCGGSGSSPIQQLSNTAMTNPGAINKLQPPKVVEEPLSPADIAKKNKVVVPTKPTMPAPQAVGRIVWVKGEIKAVYAPDVYAANKKFRVLTKNSVVYQSDLLITSKNSQAQVVFSDHTMMTFQQNTSFYIKQFQYKPEVKQGSVGKAVFDLIEGGYRTITGSIPKANPADYQVTTDVATMGVRGTDYNAFFKGCKLLMKYNNGKPILQNKLGTLDLTAEKPFASASTDQAPISLKVEPPEFKTQLPITPAKYISPAITSSPKIVLDQLTLKPGELLDKKTGLGGGACAPGAGGGGFTIFNR